MNEQWFFCVEHDRVEPKVGCASKNRLGPYDTREGAAEALELVERRNARWKAEDERWEK
jgi:hypothetical protein